MPRVPKLFLNGDMESYLTCASQIMRMVLIQRKIIEKRRYQCKLPESPMQNTWNMKTMMWLWCPLLPHEAQLVLLVLTLINWARSPM